MPETFNKAKRINVDIGFILKNNVDIATRDFYFSSLMAENGEQIGKAFQLDDPMHSDESVSKEMEQLLLEISKNFLKLNNLIENCKLQSKVPNESDKIETLSETE